MVGIFDIRLFVDDGMEVEIVGSIRVGGVRFQRRDRKIPGGFLYVVSSGRRRHDFAFEYAVQQRAVYNAFRFVCDE